MTDYIFSSAGRLLWDLSRNCMKDDGAFEQSLWPRTGTPQKLYHARSTIESRHPRSESSWHGKRQRCVALALWFLCGHGALHEAFNPDFTTSRLPFPLLQVVVFQDDSSRFSGKKRVRTEEDAEKVAFLVSGGAFACKSSCHDPPPPSFHQAAALIALHFPRLPLLQRGDATTVLGAATGRIQSSSSKPTKLGRFDAKGGAGGAMEMGRPKIDFEEVFKSVQSLGEYRRQQQQAGVVGCGRHGTSSTAHALSKVPSPSPRLLSACRCLHLHWQGQEDLGNEAAECPGCKPHPHRKDALQDVAGSEQGPQATRGEEAGGAAAVWRCDRKEAWQEQAREASRG